MLAISNEQDDTLRRFGELHGGSNLIVSRSTYAAGLLVIAAVAVAIRWHLLSQPLDRDEGLYALMAQRMLEGDVPYRDVFSDKPPVAFLIYALFLLAFGEHVVGIHLGGALWAAGAAVLLADLARRLVGPIVGLVAGLTYAIANAEGSFQGSSINLELMLTPAVLGALILLVRPRISIGVTFVAGMLLGIALLTKQQAIGHAVFAPMWLATRWFIGQDGRLLDLVGRLVGLAIGATVPLVVSILIFAQLDALAFYMDGLLGYNLNAYVRREPMVRAGANLWRSAREILAGDPLLHAAALLGLIWSMLKTRAVGWFGLTWLLLNAAAVAIGLRFYKHYFLFTLPAVVLLSSIALAWLVEQVWRTGWWIARGASLAVVVAAVASPLVIQHAYFFFWTPAEHVRELYGPELFAESERLAEYIAERTDPSETLFIDGSEPQIYFLSRRRSPTRYVFVHPLNAGGQKALPRQQAALEQIMRDPPAFVLEVAIPMSHMRELTTPRLFWEQIVAIVRAHYRAVLFMAYTENGFEYQYELDKPQKMQPDVVLFERRDRRAQRSDAN